MLRIEPSASAECWRDCDSHTQTRTTRGPGTLPGPLAIHTIERRLTVNTTTTTEAKREARVRRMAKREGLRAEKSRRDGTWHLVDMNRNTIEVGDTLNGYGMSLEQVEGVLAAD